MENLTAADYLEFDNLYRTCRPKMLGYLLKHGYGFDSEDIIQNAFLALWRKWGEYEKKDSFEPLAWGFLKNLMYKNRRTKKRRKEFSGSELVAIAATADEQDPERIVLARLELYETVSKLAALPVQTRNAIIMRSQDVPCSEISSQMDIKVKRVIKIVYEGRKTIKVA